jgi:hypothetical protein
MERRVKCEILLPDRGVNEGLGCPGVFSDVIVGSS